jgi:metal-responsive CopG/Arc/MetJ family transcriptional regulator
MPRPGPRRPMVAVRLSPDVLARVDAAAAVAGVNRSEMIRRLIADGLEKGKR